ncbi:MAG: Eco57I restriction-modification methylase domain-containing protein [Nanoarchaeota archaeon]|nr:Eco57I restriction-modification methylase domain-containing protein [Nanoarchaeota archaeon]
MLLNNIYKRRTPDILECIANLSSDEVFTPPQVANSILDLLPQEVWSNPDLKFLDPACKTGIFLRECAKRLMAGLEKAIPDEEKRRGHIFKNMLYGIALTNITSLMSRRSLYYSKNATTKYSVIKFDESSGNIIYENIKHTFKNKRCVKCGASKKILNRGDDLESHAYQFIHKNNIFNNMKFDVIMGNPPYQLESGGYGAQATPIYQKFIETAIALNPKYISMIIPSRWFDGGMGLKGFRQKMLQDKRLKNLVIHPDAGDCFPGVEIKGGVCYFLWDSKYNGECEVVNMLGSEEVSKATRNLNEYDTFIKFNEALQIIKKVKEKNEIAVDINATGLNPFGFPTNFKDYKNKEFKGSAKIYFRGGYGYIKRDLIKSNKDLVDKFKILLPKAGEGGGVFPNNITGKPILVDKNTCCTMTYFVLASFGNKKNAKNFIKYVKTRFFRFLVSLKKSTQDTSKDKFSFVPDLDISQEWTDKKLYKRYGITEKEQEFIKSIVKEMN